MVQEDKKGEFEKRSIRPLDIDFSEFETEIFQPPLKGANRNRDGTKEDPPEPSLTPDTYLLTSNACKASWIQLRTLAEGTTVVQSLPSGYIEDLGGARVTTIESICPYQRPTGEVVLVKMGMACVAAHLHIKLEDEWMTALQATQRGHGTLLKEHTCPQLLGLCLHGGGNVLINTSTSIDTTPTLIAVATRGYRPDLSSEPKLDRFITYPLHEGREGELRAALVKPSYCNMVRRHRTDVLDRPTSLETPSVPDLTSPKSRTEFERTLRLNKDESRKEDTGSPSALPRVDSARQRQMEEDVGTDSDANATPSVSKKTNPVPTPTPPTSHYLTSEPLPDIYLRTPEGEHVSELEARWEHNPYAQACGDTSGLMGLKPGHYQLQGNMVATDLCYLAQSDFLSQFFQTCPKKGPNPGLEPAFSLGKGKVVHNQRRSASRRETLEATELAKKLETRPTVTGPILSQYQKRTRASIDILKEDSIQEPTPEEKVVPLQDNELFYKNGQPKPNSTARLPTRGLTSRVRKRPRGRKRDRRRERGCRSNVDVPKGLNPETSEKINMEDEPSQPLNPVRNRSPELPTQQKGSSPEEPGTESGAACFGPRTALLVQNPLNQATYDPGKVLSRPIGEIGYGSMVLAEKQDMDGSSTLFLAKVTCMMSFEIPQDGDPGANKILQEKTLSKGLGLTLTKHHHIRKLGNIQEQEPGRWRCSTPVNNPAWSVAADSDVTDLEPFSSRSGISPTTVTESLTLCWNPQATWSSSRTKTSSIYQRPWGTICVTTQRTKSRLEEAGRFIHDTMPYNCKVSPSSPEASYIGDKER